MTRRCSGRQPKSASSIEYHVMRNCEVDGGDGGTVCILMTSATTTSLLLHNHTESTLSSRRTSASFVTATAHFRTPSESSLSPSRLRDGCTIWSPGQKYGGLAAVALLR